MAAAPMLNSASRRAQRCWRRYQHMWSICRPHPTAMRQSSGETATEPILLLAFASAARSLPWRWARPATACKAVRVSECNGREPKKREAPQRLPSCFELTTGSRASYEGRRLKKPSILRHLRVHALGPRVDSPGEIVDFRESRLAQEINRLGAAPAHLAVGDDLAAGVEFVHATG